MTRAQQIRAIVYTVLTVKQRLSYGDVPLSKFEQKMYNHIQGMPDRITEKFSNDKIGRWLGWIQGVSCAYGLLTLDECKKINKDMKNS